MTWPYSTRLTIPLMISPNPHNQRYLDTKRDNAEWVIRALYTSPSTLEGTIYLAWDAFDLSKQARQGWIYNAGQRRVRRAPDLAYDSITDGTEGMRYTDQYDAYNGAPDRFDFKLLGKKEIYVPYNTYKLADKKVKQNGWREA